MLVAGLLMVEFFGSVEFELNFCIRAPSTVPKFTISIRYN